MKRVSAKKSKESIELYKLELEKRDQELARYEKLFLLDSISKIHDVLDIQKAITALDSFPKVSDALNMKDMVNAKVKVKMLRYHLSCIASEVMLLGILYDEDWSVALNKLPKLTEEEKIELESLHKIYQPNKVSSTEELEIP